MQSTMYLDCETTHHKERVRHWLTTHPLRARANLVDPVKIAADLKKKEDAVNRDAMRNRFALQLKVISWALDDGPVKTCVNHGANEKEALTTLKQAMGECDCIVTFNGNSSDIPWIRTAFSFNGIHLPYVLRSENRYAQQRLVDMREVLTNFDSRAEGKLADWCFSFGVEGPLPHGVEDIERMVREKDWDGLTTTCEQDVEAVRRLHKKAAHLGWL